jgi:hypothetical protein
MLRVLRSGGCHYYVAGHIRGEGGTRLAIGPVRSVKLADARERAGAMLSKMAMGERPLTAAAAQRDEARQIREAEAAEEAARAAAAEAEHRRKTTSFGEVSRGYYVAIRKRLRSANDVEREIARHTVAWNDKPIDAITRRDVIQLIAGIVDDGKPATARNLLAMLKPLFGWAALHGRYPENLALPTDRVRADALAGKAPVRERVLGDVEIRVLWRASEKLGNPYGDLMRLLLLTGGRLREIAHAAHHEIEAADDGTVWLCVPGSRMKAGRSHRVPLGRVARGIIEAAPRRGARGMILTEPSGRPLVAFSRIKARIDEAAAMVAAETGAPGIATPWTFHDTRRSFRTGLSELGVPDHVAELCIAHVRGGIVAVYDKHKFGREIIEAFEAWEQRLMVITTGGTVVSLPVRPAGRR